MSLNWAYHIRSMLQSLGLTNLWIEQDMLMEQDNYDALLIVIKQRILDQYYQLWYSEINNSQRLISYSRYKHTFELEPYLDIIHDKKLKSKKISNQIPHPALKTKREITKYIN